MAYGLGTLGLPVFEVFNDARLGRFDRDRSVTAPPPVELKCSLPPDPGPRLRTFPLEQVPNQPRVSVSVSSRVSVHGFSGWPVELRYNGRLPRLQFRSRPS